MSTDACKNDVIVNVMGIAVCVRVCACVGAKDAYYRTVLKYLRHSWKCAARPASVLYSVMHMFVIMHPIMVITRNCVLGHIEIIEYA